MKIAAATTLLLTALLAQAAAAGPQTFCSEPRAGTADHAAMIRARQHLFGFEHVDAQTGAVRDDKVILSWVGISSYAAALRGRIVLLDAYIQYRTERPGYVPATTDELIALNPEAVFIGHGHGDHAELAAEIVSATCAQVVGTPEHCADIEAGVQAITGDDRSISCSAAVSAGSGIGTEVNEIRPLGEDICITAFKHVHSEAMPPDAEREPNPPLFAPDPGVYRLYPPGRPSPADTQAGLAGDEGSSVFYQFRMDDFSLVWTDTVGPVKEKAPQLMDLMRGLPTTDVMLGAIIGFNVFSNGFRDAAMYVDAVSPQIFVPNHHDFIAPDGAQDEWEGTFAKDLQAIPEQRRPELRWMLNPYDYVTPSLLTFDLDSPAWTQPDGNRPVAACYAGISEQPKPRKPKK